MKVSFLNQVVLAIVISAMSLVVMSMAAKAAQGPENTQKQQEKDQKAKKDHPPQALQTKPDQPPARQLNPDPPNAVQTKPDQPEADQLNPDPPRAEQTKPDQPEARQLNPAPPRAVQAKQDQTKADQVRQDKQRAEQVEQEELRAQELQQGRPPGWDKGKKVGWGDGSVPPGKQARLPEPQRQQRIVDQQRNLDQYRQHLDQQQRIADQRSAQLQQQRRMAQYQYQQQYYDGMRQQQMRLRDDRHDYDNDPYFYTAANYRYNRDGRFYETNQYGANVLRDAVNNGYEQGFRAGEADRHDRWSGSYQDSYAYQDANYGYGGYYVPQDEYNYYFRQGFQRGYEDGYNSRYRYGSYSNGKYTILDAILGSIIDMQLIR